MTLEECAAQNHAAAATHHLQAMEFHLVAAKHYQIGTEFAHAAYLALVAHAHTLKAMDYWQQAIDDFAEHGVLPSQEIFVVRQGDPWKTYMNRLLVENTSLAVARPLNGAEHHVAAAGHAKHAAQHHNHASIHCDGRQFPLAARESRIARDHALHSAHHGNEAARHYVKHCGPVGAADGCGLRI